MEARSSQEVEAVGNGHGRVEEKEEQADVWRDRYLRIAAELDNSKKRYARNYAMQAEQSQEKLLRALLPVADNLQRALENIPAHEADSSLYAGVRLSLREFLGTLAKYGVEPITALGEAFDPELHEAVGVAPHPGFAPDTVIHVEQKGYTYNDRLLRPARVIIAAG